MVTTSLVTTAVTLNVDAAVLAVPHEGSLQGVASITTLSATARSWLVHVQDAGVVSLVTRVQALVLPSSDIVLLWSISCVLKKMMNSGM